MIDLTNKRNLEDRFAEDFATPYFPILANIYLLEGNLVRAKKVCEVGLKYDDNNVDGKFLLAKIAVAENKITTAEKILKKIVAKNLLHFNALRLLIEIEIKLNRSPNTIKSYINKILQFIPNDKQCVNWLNKIKEEAIQKNSQNINFNNDQEVQAIKENKTQQIKNIKNDDIKYEVTESMATFTMVKILKNQKHYNQALNVLNTLKSMGRNSDRIEQEKQSIKQILKETKD